MYEENRTAEMALRYAKMLFNLSIEQNKIETVETADRMGELYKEHPNEEIALLYFNIMFNITFGPHEEQMEAKARELYKEHQTPKIAFQYSEILLNESGGQNEIEVERISREIKALYNKYETNQLAISYGRIRFDLLRMRKFGTRSLVDIMELTDFETKIHLLVLKRLISQSSYTKEELSQIFRDFQIHIIEEEENELDYIFKETKGFKCSGKLKVELVSLLYYVIRLKEQAVYRIGEQDSVAHYTKLKALKHILGTQNNSKEPTLRISNSEFMNDPSEGKTFIELLKKQAEGAGRDNVEKLEDILNELYQISCTNQNDSDKNTREKINRSNMYIGSFSTSIDNLPMWSQYGDDGEGCCLIFKNDFFDKRENQSFETKALNPTKPKLVGDVSNQNEVKEKYVLYKVNYIGEKETEKENKEIIDKIVDSLIELSSIRKDEELKDNEEIMKRIDAFIIGTLDQVRFLFKDKSYEYEKEKRIIKFSYNPKEDEGDLIVPRLYINIAKDIKYKEIILGPKVLKVSEIAPYLYNTGKVTEVTRSSIKYR